MPIEKGASGLRGDLEAKQHRPGGITRWPIRLTVIKVYQTDLDQGLGRERNAGVIWTVRLVARPGDGELITSGSYRLLSARSIALFHPLFEADLSMGIEKTRFDSVPQIGQGSVAGAVPIGRITSNSPSWSH
jgi:hypothetical protein